MLRPTWDPSRSSGEFAYRTVTCSGWLFHAIRLSPRVPRRGPATPRRKRRGLGFSAFARHYLRNHGCFLFHRILRCFTSPGAALKPYVFRLQCSAMTRNGFPHSEIFGSKRVCRSPKLIAAYHVLRRLLMPRHPLCALCNLTE